MVMGASPLLLISDIFAVYVPLTPVAEMELITTVPELVRNSWSMMVPAVLVNV